MDIRFKAPPPMLFNKLKNWLSFIILSKISSGRTPGIGTGM